MPPGGFGPSTRLQLAQLASWAMKVALIGLGAVGSRVSKVSAYPDLLHLDVSFRQPLQLTPLLNIRHLFPVKSKEQLSLEYWSNVNERFYEEIKANDITVINS